MVSTTPSLKKPAAKNAPLLKTMSSTRKQSTPEPEAYIGFTKATLTFLRGLARTQDREWFEARRGVYEQALRQPMLETIARVNKQMESFAPMHIKAPEKTVLRIYRDTRFSKNKQPYKQQYAAWWGRKGMEKTSGAGYYFHLSAKQLHIAAGLYMPDAAQTLAVRRFLVDHHEEFRAIVGSRALKSRMQLADPQPMTRSPKGFAPDHPANDLIMFRNWGVDVELGAEEALGEQFSALLAGYFRAAAPLVDFLNTPLGAAPDAVKRPIFALPSR